VVQVRRAVAAGVILLVIVFVVGRRGAGGALTLGGC